MFRSKNEFKKIYDSMNENCIESLKEYREYIAEHSSFYISMFVCKSFYNQETYELQW